jgi:hypothetical protein
LYGRIDSDLAIHSPPSDKRELNAQQRKANAIINQVFENFGKKHPDGALFIDGWSPKKDWLRWDQLLPLVSDLTKDQVFIFGLSDEDKAFFENDGDFSLLLEDGVIVLHEQRLGRFLSEHARELEETAVVSLDGRLRGSEVVLRCVSSNPKEIPSTPDEKSLKDIKFSKNEMRRFEDSFMPLVPLSFTRPIEKNIEERARAFQNFLMKPQFEQAAGFVFRRPLYETLLKKVKELANKDIPQDYTLLLCGQTGVGKTSLLFLLAVELRESGFPVLFIPKVSGDPLVDHIDTFIRRLEDAKCLATTIVIWDGLQEPTEYQKLSQSLTSLGRKALVIGTCHDIALPEDNSKRKTKSKVEVDLLEDKTKRKTESKVEVISLPVDLLPDERELMSHHFSRFNVGYSRLFDQYSPQDYRNIFELFYLVFYDIRPQLEEGVCEEINSSIDRLQDKIETIVNVQGGSTQDSQKNSLLGEAIRKVMGDRFDEMIRNARETNPDVASKRESMFKGVLQLVNGVMVAGKFGVDVPYSIALRLLSHEPIKTFKIALDNFPVLSSKTSAKENESNFLGPRIGLEADIWCRRQGMDDETQYKIIEKMVLTLRNGECSINNEWGAEIEFAIKLLQQIGPQGREKKPRLFLDIANTIAQLRKKTSSLNTRLLLVEANCIREWLRENDKSTNTSNAEELLDRAERVLTQAEENLQAGPTGTQTQSTKKLKANILTERAALNGSRLIRWSKRLANPPAPPKLFEEYQNLIHETQHILRRAFSCAEDNAHAYDTACWVYRFYYNNAPPNEINSDILLDWCDVIDRYRQLDLTPDQELRLDDHERSLAEALGDDEKFERLFQQVKNKNLPYAHVLKARHMLESSQDADGACKYILEQFPGEDIYQNRYALLFYYRLWWSIHTGSKRYFKPDTPFLLSLPNEKWGELQKLAEARLKLDGEKENSLALFHAAWALIQINNGRQARDHLELLKNGSKGSSRRGRALTIISTSDGKTREFNGQTRFSTDPVNGRCWIDSLQMELPYKYFDFNNGKHTGTPLGPFQVALNYRGAYIQKLGMASKGDM